MLGKIMDRINLGVTEENWKRQPLIKENMGSLNEIHALLTHYTFMKSLFI